MTRSVAAPVAALVIGFAGAALAQSATLSTGSLPSFEAASIKAPDPAGIGAIDLRFFPTRFVATTVTLSQLIEQAYGIEAREILGGPDWVRADRFDVTATSGDEVSVERMRLMLRALLAERFLLQLEREERTGTIYRLTARNVRGLNPPARPDERSLVSTMRNDSNGFLSYDYVGRNATVGALALRLSQQLRAPVIDETNLTGNYDFRISFAYDEPFGGLQPDPNVPTIFTALENQVGLKLVADKGAIPVHVIRRVSKPSAN